MDMDRDQIEGVNGVNSQENSQEFVDTKDTPIETEFTHGMEHEEEATLDGSLSNSIGFERISASTEFQSGEDYDTVEHASNSKVHESTSLETADRLIRNKSNSGVRLASNGQDLEQGVHQASFSIEIVDTGIIEAQSTEPLEACSSKTSENQKVQPVEAVKVELTEQEDQAIEDLFGDTALTSPSPTTDKSQNPMTETAKKVMTLVEGMSTSSTLERAETPKGFAKNIKLHDQYDAEHFTGVKN